VAGKAQHTSTLARMNVIDVAAQRVREQREQEQLEKAGSGSAGMGRPSS
jgi:hypothetical protein